MTEARVVRVLPDVAAIDKTFDYLVPEEVAADIRVGTMVRIELHGRRVGGWVVAQDVEPPPGVTVRPLAKVRGWGPEPDTFDLAHWAAWRWAGRVGTLARSASPERAVRVLPPPSPGGSSAAAGADEVSGLVARAWSAAEEAGVAVLRLPPAALTVGVCIAGAQRGDTLVLAPSIARGARVARRLRDAGVTVALHPDDWARARAGSTVVGSRAAAWAPMPRLGSVVVLDEHDEVYHEERAPTWHARDVVVERARRAGVPCVLVSPAPTLEALACGPLVEPTRGDERAGWAHVEVVDRRGDDPGRSGLFSERVVDVARGAGRIVCILNRTGRARLLACGACGSVARCEMCDAAVVQIDDGTLHCPRCGTSRPKVCQSCNGTKMRTIRSGVTRAREELEALVREPVAEVTAARVTAGTPDFTTARVVIGTEAALHRAGRADAVVFLDMDQELLAHRYRAAEQAFGLLVRAARMVGRRAGDGRVVVQTRHPDHESLQAALHGQPAIVADAERSRREALRLPPFSAIAAVSGAGAAAFIKAFGLPTGIEVSPVESDRWLLRAPDHAVLCDALAKTTRPPGRLRVEVDPLRI